MLGRAIAIGRRALVRASLAPGGGAPGLGGRRGRAASPPRAAARRQRPEAPREVSSRRASRAPVSRAELPQPQPARLAPTGPLLVRPGGAAAELPPRLSAGRCGPAQPG